MGTSDPAIEEDRPTDPHSAEVLPTLPAERIKMYVDRPYELGKRYAVAIAKGVGLSPVQQRLDIAGGSGIYSIAFAQRQPTLQATVIDLPPIVPFTQEIIARYGMHGRVTAHPGNYFQDDFAGGNDLVLLSNSLQTKGGTTCRMLLRKVFEALAPSGQLVIHGVISPLDRVTPPQPALFQVHMLLSFTLPSAGFPFVQGRLDLWVKMRLPKKVRSARIAPARARSMLLAATPAQESCIKGKRDVDNVTTKESLWESWTF